MEALDERRDLLVRRPACEPALDRVGQHRDREDAVMVSTTRTLSPPISCAASSALWNVPETFDETWSEYIRSYEASSSYAVDEVLGRRLRGRRCHGRRAQLLVELRRAQLQVVAERLVAEADVQRDEAHVREARRRVGVVRRRVEDDRRVLARQVHCVTSRRLPGLRARARRSPRPCARARRPRSTRHRTRRGPQTRSGKRRRRRALARRSAATVGAVESGRR